MMHVLVTGANRGLGLEFARQYLEDGWHVLATCRNPDSARELKKLGDSGRLDVLQLDVNDPSSFADFATRVSQKADRLDLLINNAGMYPEDSISEKLTPEALMSAFRTNTVGPIMLARALVPLLEPADGTIVNISSTMGSIDSKRGEGAMKDYAYSISKAALNMGTLLLANDLRAKNITVIAQCPGWVQTDMGGSNAQLKPEESISAMRKTFAKLTIDDTGRFQNRFGDPIAD